MTVQPSDLSQHQVVQIRNELERTLRKLERNISRSSSDGSREIDQSAVGRLSRIEALQNQGLTQKLKERERTQFEEVAQALLRLDEGTYGRCSECGTPIRSDRLMIFPETRTCSGCGNGY